MINGIFFHNNWPIWVICNNNGMHQCISKRTCGTSCLVKVLFCEGNIIVLFTDFGTLQFIHCSSFILILGKFNNQWARISMTYLPSRYMWLKHFSILWLARSFALSRYNHCAVIITLKASSFQNRSQIFWCFGVRNWSILLFSRIIMNVIILKQ